MIDPSTLRPEFALSTGPCKCCGTTGLQHLHLVHDSGESIDVCLRCVRSSMRMKADTGDQRGTLLLEDYAEEHAWHVWRSDNAVYLLPPIRPFAVATAATAMENAAVRTSG